MRLARTLSGYLLRETLLHTALGLVAISVVLVSRNLLRFLDELIAVGFSLGDLVDVMRCLFAMLVAYALPVALLFGVLLSLSRMAADTEIVAMRACGIGLREILAPLVLLGLVVSGVTAYLLIGVEYQARRDLRTLVKNMALRGQMLEPGRFRRLGERVVFVKSRESINQLGGVVIADRSDPKRPFMIFAERGSFEVDDARGRLHFRLENGDIHLEPNGGGEGEDEGQGEYHRIAFATFDYAFDSHRLLSDDFSRLDPRQMSMGELREVLAHAEAGKPLTHVRVKEPVQYELQVHRRLALPLAPILLVLVAAPLGMRRRRGARAWSALLCGALAFAYYAILTLSMFVSRQGAVPPAVALWAPNVLFAGTAALLLRRARNPDE